MSERNSSFSPILPTLQIALDSTSLGAFKTCPRLYQLSILEGWKPREESIHLTWGLLIHAAIEQYYRLTFGGASHNDALDEVVWTALRNTWKDGRPWQSDEPTKTRLTLIRTIVWYLDRFGQNDPLKTLQLSDGRPAVELSFRFPTEIKSRTSETFILCGHIDRIVTFNDSPWIVDFKSTKSTLTNRFFASFSPDNQFSIYIIAGQIMYSIPVSGIIIDGCQTAVTFSRFERQLSQRSEYQISEWLDDLPYWLENLEKSAHNLASKGKNFPMNDKSCGMYGGCPYRPVCSAPSESTRQDLLKAGYYKRIWDPLQARGDI